MSKAQARLKAQARFIEYVLVVLFSVLVIVSITTIFYTFYRLALENEIKQSLKQLAVQTSDSLVRLYEASKNSKAQPSNSSSVLISEVNLNYPSSVSRRNYEIILVTANPIWATIKNLTAEGRAVSFVEKGSGAKIIAQTTQDPAVTVEYDVPNIDTSVQGLSRNGQEAKLRYYRFNLNGTIYDRITLGQSDILITLGSVS